MEKKLTLIATKKSYTDTVTHTTKEYWSYCVDCGGIRVAVKPAEKLGYQLLNNAAENAK